MFISVDFNPREENERIKKKINQKNGIEQVLAEKGAYVYNIKKHMRSPKLSP